MYRVKYLPKSNEAPRYHSGRCKLNVVVDDEKTKSSAVFTVRSFYVTVYGKRYGERG